MSLLARIVAREEGFGIPGSIPTVRMNPGDLRHAPGASHDGIGPNDIGIEPSVEQGWADLERQLQLYASRGLTLRDMIINYYAPPGENDSERYLAFVCQVGDWSPKTLVSVALETP